MSGSFTAPSASQTALAKRLAERAGELLRQRRVGSLFTALAEARSEVESAQRAELTHAVAQAYALIAEPEVSQ